MSVPIQSISFWCNAFIPRDIAGATTALGEGEYRGLTVLTGAPCYLTDQRNFSNAPDARSRMHSRVRVEITDSAPSLTQRHRCDELIECDRVSGNVLNRRRGSILNMKFSLAGTDPTILIRVDGRQTDPLAPTADDTGEIEYRGAIAVNPAARAIEIDLMICLFPAFEGYAAINDGQPAILFRHAPPAGILSLGPPSGAQRRIRSRLVDHDGDGIFETTAAET